jgi:DNA invertase Pin-like site-specific DNA recombinase
MLGLQKPRYGSDNVVSKLNEEQVLKIRELSLMGISNLALAEMFNISRPSISAIINWKSWKHLRANDN